MENRTICAVFACLIFIALVNCSCVQKRTAQQSNTANDTVRINISSEPDSLDPWQSAAADTSAIFRNVFDGLMIYSPSGALIPGIAERYEVSEEGLVYTFYLAKNVLFHNGKKLTSSDVEYTYNSMAGLHGMKPMSSKFKHVKDTAAPDDYTFIVTLSEPDAAFLSLTESAILPEGYSEQSVHPVGAGPFKFVEYVPGQKIVLERNEDYYNTERKAKIKRAEVYIMTNMASVVSALRSGELDAAYFINGTDAESLKNDFTVLSSPQNMVQLFGLNNSVKPFDDIRVREAIDCVVNKKDLIEGVWNGFATELYTNFSPALSEYYNSQLSTKAERNKERALQLLQEAGYENGFDVTITVPANYEPHVTAAQILVSQLAEANIRAKIESIDWASWLDRVYSKAQYETTVMAFAGKTEPNDILGRFCSDYPKNFLCFRNAEYDKIMASAAVETDHQKRVELYKECQRILADNVASIYICDPNLIVALRKDLTGYTFYPFNYIDFSSMRYQ